MTYQRAGGDKRGNSADRYARKTWMLNTFGDGTKCPCTHCERLLGRRELEADRIIPGGSYRHENIQPSCRDCNLARSNDMGWVGYDDLLPRHESPRARADH